MQDKVQISNMALANVGHTAFIDSMTDKSVEAELCNRFLRPAQLHVLSSTDWPFATKHVRLEPSPEEPPSPWLAAYLYPQDVVTVRAIDNGLAKSRHDQKIEYAEMQLGGRRCIVTELIGATTPVTAICTAAIFITEQYPFEIDDVLAWRLACEIAVPLTKSPQMHEYAIAKYKEALDSARVAAGQSIQSGVDPAGQLLDPWGSGDAED